MENEKNKFQLVKYRLHLDDPQILLVQGWFTKNELEENEVFFLLGDKRLSASVTTNEGIEVRKKYVQCEYNIDKEFYYWIHLPENMESKQYIRVFEKSESGKSRLITAIPCEKIIKKRNVIDKYIEDPIVGEHIVTLNGWYAIPKKDGKVDITIFDTRNQKISYTMETTYRADVATEYPEAKEGELIGFELKFEHKGEKSVLIVLQNAGKRTEYKCYINPSKMTKGLRKIEKLCKKTIQYTKNFGVKKAIDRAYVKIFKIDENDYKRWLKKNSLTQDEIEAQKRKKFEKMPLISIVVPLYKTPKQYLKELIESVQEQTYPNWELCLSDGSGENSPLQQMLKRYALSDKRIKIILNDEQLQISENTNRAIEQASGDYIAFADHDDLLTPDALYECVKALNKNPEIDVLYSDEDKITMDGKEYFEPHFKTDFNIDLLRSMNYICHLFVVDKNIIEKVGMLDSDYDGAQDYDMVLRCVEVAKKVYHIPRVLYHWRAHKDSTADNPQSKMYAFDAGRRAVQAHYDRVGINAKVHQGEYLGLYKTEHLISEKPMISIIIPNKDHIEDLDKCISSIETKSTYENYEFIVVENNSEKASTFRYYEELQKKNSRVNVVHWDKEFNYSAINNFGAQFAKGEYLLLLNNDTSIINSNCLEELVGYCMHEDVGAVGARLYYEDDTIQHAGVIVGFGGIAGHAFIGLPRSANGYFSRIICAQDMSAVTAACMMVKKKVFDQVGGLDTKFKVAFNDIDLCMKIRKEGYLIVYNPYAELYHYESKSRGMEDTPEKVRRFNSEIDRFKMKWPEILVDGDPYYNPNLSMERCDFGLK